MNELLRTVLTEDRSYFIVSKLIMSVLEYEYRLSKAPENFRSLTYKEKKAILDSIGEPEDKKLLEMRSTTLNLLKGTTQSIMTFFGGYTEKRLTYMNKMDLFGAKIKIIIVSDKDVERLEKATGIRLGPRVDYISDSNLDTVYRLKKMTLPVNEIGTRGKKFISVISELQKTESTMLKEILADEISHAITEVTGEKMTYVVYN